MFDAHQSNTKYRPTLLDRLVDSDFREKSDTRPLRLISIEELKESVARDLEFLLNCRSAVRDDLFVQFPESARSICSYGMSDFVGLSLASPSDRNHICRSLERTISIHESRLKQVSVVLESSDGEVNRLKFAIHALLVVHPSSEPVYFDALLQPSTLQYSVSKKRRAISP